MGFNLQVNKYCSWDKEKKFHGVWDLISRWETNKKEVEHFRKLCEPIFYLVSIYINTN